MSSLLHPVFFPQHAYAPYNTLQDRRSSERPLKNQQKKQTLAVGWLRTSGRRKRSRRSRGCPRRAHDSSAACGRARGGLQCARRLRSLSRLDRRLRRGTQQHCLLALTPYFFHGTLSCHSTRYSVTEQHNSRPKISRKCRLQPQVTLGAHVGAARARPQRPWAPVTSPRRLGSASAGGGDGGGSGAVGGSEHFCSWRRMLGT